MAFDGGRPQEPARRAPPVDIGSAIIIASLIITVPLLGVAVLIWAWLWGKKT